MTMRERLEALVGKRVPMSVVVVMALVFLLPQFLPRLAASLQPKSPQVMADGLDLKDFIVKVKSDLEEAEKVELRKGEKPLLQLEDVQLVANFVVQSKAEAEVKLVTVNGSALSGIERSQQITLHMKPVPPSPSTVPPETRPIGTDGDVVGPAKPPQKGARQ